MSEFDDIEDGEGGGENAPPAGAESVEVSAGVMDGACLSCGGAMMGVFCANCGQKNDDLRRSIFLLGRDFIEDTFAFDSRMWRTLGVLAVVPGAVPTNYAHGKRSRYTPPVRLFLVVSFLFFLTIALTQTMFVAMEITPKTATQIAKDKTAQEAVVEELEAEGVINSETGEAVLGLGDGNVVSVGGENIDCKLNFNLRFFIKSKSVVIDQERWRACAESVRTAANFDVTSEEGVSDAAQSEKVRDQFDRILTGVSSAVEDPLDFNTEINNWLPRVMFLMTPIAALIMGVFIRGRDALFFDHMVMSLYSHAVAFTLAGSAIVLTQMGVPYVGVAAALGLFAYSVMALKQAYGRGWVKTVYSTIMVGAFYLTILSVAVIAIVIRIVLKG